MTGRWFRIRVKSPSDWRRRTIKYLANPHYYPGGQTAEEVHGIYTGLYPRGTRIEVEITEAAPQG